MTIPKFKHDCKHCRFLGIYQEHDLYFCGTNAGTPDNHHATVIARYGDEGSHYRSGLIFAFTDGGVMKEAVKRSIDTGLLTKEAYKESTGQEWI